MAAASLIWHGVILNDLNFIPKPAHIFYSLFTLTYVVIGFALTFVYNYLSMGIGLKLKSSIIGVTMGFFIYLIAFVLGVSFKGNGGTPHVLMDFIWQMLEQGAGGSVIGLIYMLARRRDKFFESEKA